MARWEREIIQSGNLNYFLRNRRMSGKTNSQLHFIRDELSKQMLDTGRLSVYLVHLGVSGYKTPIFLPPSNS